MLSMTFWKESFVFRRFGRHAWIANRTFVAILLASWIPVSLTVAQTAPAVKPQPRFATAVEAVLTQGHQASLPPHISHLLGISPHEEEVPVRQFVQMGELVKGFEVSLADENDVVIFVENRAQKETTFYLASAHGTLRKVVSVQEGVGHDRAPNATDHKAFAVEKQFWVDHLFPGRK